MQTKILAPDRAPQTAYDLVGELRALAECLERRGDVRGHDAAALAGDAILYQRRMLGVGTRPPEPTAVAKPERPRLDRDTRQRLEAVPSVREQRRGW